GARRLDAALGGLDWFWIVRVTHPRSSKGIQSGVQPPHSTVCTADLDFPHLRSLLRRPAPEGPGASALAGRRDVLPFAIYSNTPNDTEYVAVILSVIVGAIFLTVSLAALLLWVARGRRGTRLPRITPIDDQIGAMWA